MNLPADVAPKLPPKDVRAAQVLVGCTELDPTLDFFEKKLGFVVDTIFPADNPHTAMISGHGLNLRLVAGASSGATDLYLLCDPAPKAGTAPLVAPNGLRIHWVAADPPMRQPATQQQLVVSRGAQAQAWITGRAGMRYRDLIPGRLGGAFIASHIRIVDGGPVPDYVHFHKIRFQAIFCRTGWVRVVYEGRGEPLVMHSGDCVLQPPLIRHRVLESSAGAEVIEIGSPAEHVTMAEHQLQLPSGARQPGREFDGQRFVFHQASTGHWAPWRVDGFQVQDTGIGVATGGLAGVRIVRPGPVPAQQDQAHRSEFCFFFVLSGSVCVEVDGQRHDLRCDDSITIPDNVCYSLVEPSVDLQLLEVSLPAELRA